MTKKQMISDRMTLDGASWSDLNLASRAELAAAIAEPVLAKAGKIVTTKVVPIVAGAAIAVGAASCKPSPVDVPEPEEPTVSVCECPEGTTHEPGEECCDGEECPCEQAEPVQEPQPQEGEATLNGVDIPVTIAVGLEDIDIDDAIETIEEGYEGLSDANRLKLDGKINGIDIVAGGWEVCSFNKATGIATLGVDIFDLPGALQDYFEGYLIPNLARVDMRNAVQIAMGRFDRQYA